MEVDSDIADFSRRDITLLGRTKPVLLTGATGPAVIVIHKVYGFTPTLRASAAGCAMRVPSVRADPVRLARCWQHREANAAAYSIALCVARVHAACGKQIQPGDGLAARPRASCPSGMRWPRRRSYRHVPDGWLCTFHGARSGRARPGTSSAGLPATGPRPRHLACRSRPSEGAHRDGLKLRGYRFEGDTICRASRFQTLRTALGAAFAGTELPDSAANPAGMKAQGKAPHSVLPAT